jgi:hypothetical protein
MNIDAPPVADEAEALSLMLHHLKLAAAYFEATPEDLSAHLTGDHFSAPAIGAWLVAMEALYPKD